MNDHLNHEHDHGDGNHDHGHDHEHPDDPRPARDWDALRLKYTPYLSVLLVACVLYSTFFTVAETEFALVTQFGRPVDTVTEAGLHVKWPYQSATYFDRRLRVYNPRPSEFLTRDKKNLVIESYVLWQIDDPEVFVQTVGDEVAAEMRLHDITWAGLAAAMGNHDLDAIVSPDPEKLQTQRLLDELTEQTGARALEEYGIRVADVRIKRLNLPEQNKQSVFARMRAERERIARQYRAEGEEQALRIRADADRQREETLSLAYKQAEQTKGEGDAEAARVYGRAYSRNPQFYKLVRTLEAYKKALDDQTTVILSSDSELLRLLTRGQ
jgi:membrane protease subunit HflC